MANTITTSLTSIINNVPPVKALDALVSLVVELAVDRLVVIVHHLESVRSVPWI